MSRKNKALELELEHERTRQHLEGIARGIVDSFNNHDFSPVSPAWRCISPHFRANPEFSMRQHSDREGNNDLSFPEFLALVQRAMEARPGHQMEVISMATVIDKAGPARVFLTMHPQEESSREFAVQHIAVWQFTFDEDQNEWLCVREYGLRGFG